MEKQLEKLIKTLLVDGHLSEVGYYEIKNWINENFSNSDAQGESRNVSQNEAKKEVCPYCNSSRVYERDDHYDSCQDCSAEWVG